MTRPVFSLNQSLGAVGLQPVAESAVRRSCQTMALCDRLAGLAVPDDRRLALVGDADRGDVPRPDLRAAERFDADADLRRPDFLRVVLDPAGLRKDLCELLLRDRADGAVVIEDDGARTGRALIEREDVRHGRVTIQCPRQDSCRKRSGAELLAEFFGTLRPDLFGVGVVAQVVP